MIIRLTIITARRNISVREKEEKVSPTRESGGAQHATMEKKQQDHQRGNQRLQTCNSPQPPGPAAATPE